MLIDHWPLLGLLLRTERLEVRLPTEPELADLADQAAAGIDEHGHETLPWTMLDPAGRARSMVQAHWLSRGSWSPDDWTLDLAVFARGRPVGMQTMRAVHFGTSRTVTTTSWLSREQQGRGFGTEMWAAMLHLAFDGLGAVHARTGPLTDHPAAAAVARKLGYRPELLPPIETPSDRSSTTPDHGWRLDRADRENAKRPRVTSTGLPACRSMFAA